MKAVRSLPKVEVAPPAAVEAKPRATAVDRLRSKAFLARDRQSERARPLGYVKATGSASRDTSVPPQAASTPTKTSGAKAPKRGAGRAVTLFVARGGPARGEADYEVAFPSRPAALAFLANQHGLTTEEIRRLARESRLKLDRKWHGSVGCSLREVAVPASEAPSRLAA